MGNLGGSILTREGGLRVTFGEEMQALSRTGPYGAGVNIRIPILINLGNIKVQIVTYLLGII